MSRSIFLKNNLHELLSETASNTTSVLPSWLNIVDINSKNTQKNHISKSSADNYSATSSQLGGGDSATSQLRGDSATSSQLRGDSATSSQLRGDSATSSQIGGGGEYSATSSQLRGDSATSSQLRGDSATSSQIGGGDNVSTTTDINQLISMLTSENNTLSNTNTAQLENQLRSMLKNQKAGSLETDEVDKLNSIHKELDQKIVRKTKKLEKRLDSNYREHYSMKKDIQDLKKIINDLRTKGLSVNVKLNDEPLSEYAKQVTETELSLSSVNPHSPRRPVSPRSVRRPVSPLRQNNSVSALLPSETSSSSPHPRPTTVRNVLQPVQVQAQAGGARKSSKKSSKKTSKKLSLDGGAVRPEFQAFLDLKKFIATKLDQPNGVKMAKIASAVKNDTKSKHPDLNTVELCKEAMKHFSENKEKYAKMV